MGKIASRLPRATTGVPNSDIDRWLARAANLSQTLLLLLGVFGYFYTVLPLYAKALLDEEIAQKTLELREKERQVGALTSQIQSRTADLRQKDELLRLTEQKAASADRNLKRAEAAATEAGKVARSAQVAREESETRARLATSVAQEQYIAFRREVVTTASDRVYWCVINIGLNSTLIDRNLFRTCITRHLTEVSRALNQLQAEDRTRYVEAARRLLDELEPKFLQHAQSVNARVQEKEIEEKQRKDLGKAGSITDWKAYYDSIDKDHAIRTDGYKAILVEFTTRLRGEVLR